MPNRFTNLLVAEPRGLVQGPFELRCRQGLREQDEFMLRRHIVVVDDGVLLCQVSGCDIKSSAEDDDDEVSV